MEAIALAESPIDSEIAAVRLQIEALRHRRSLLSHALLSSRKFKQQLEQAKLSPTSLEGPVQSVSSLVEDSANITVTNLHRTCSGITAFRIQDPDPNAADSGKVLGIRFDIFSRERRAFRTPYYILLHHPHPESRQLKIHKHTIPPYVPLPLLVSKHLPFHTEHGEASKQQHEQNLPRLVRALRKELVAHHKRIEACEVLRQELGDFHGVEKVQILDVTGRELEIRFTGGTLARVRISTDGKIQRAAVGPSLPLNEEERTAPNFRMERQIKRAVEDGDDGIDGLVKRLKNRSRH